MGDVVGSAENELLERDLLPKADILKVAHHGNANGTSRRFLKRVEPALALLPAPLRKNDPWGKPDPELIRRLQNFRIPTFQTGKVGAISVRFDEQTLRSVKIGASPLGESNQN
jgi:competence protein ComEC